MEPKRPNSPCKPEKEQAGSITLADFKVYYKPIRFKTVWYWHRKEDIEISGPEQKAHK